jgi:hypothetical protein
MFRRREAFRKGVGELSLGETVLLREWDMCEAGIARYDGFLFQIRSWAVTAFSGVIALAVTKGRPEICFLAILIIVAFWISEGSAKVYQYTFICRVREIEAALRKRNAAVFPALADRFEKESFKWGSSKTRTENNHWPKWQWDQFAMSGKHMVSGHSFPLYFLMIVAALVLGFSAYTAFGARLFEKEAEAKSVQMSVTAMPVPAAAQRVDAIACEPAKTVASSGTASGIDAAPSPLARPTQPRQRIRRARKSCIATASAAAAGSSAPRIVPR